MCINHHVNVPLGNLIHKKILAYISEDRRAALLVPLCLAVFLTGACISTPATLHETLCLQAAEACQEMATAWTSYFHLGHLQDGQLQKRMGGAQLCMQKVLLSILNVSRWDWEKSLPETLDSHCQAVQVSSTEPPTHCEIISPSRLTTHCPTPGIMYDSQVWGRRIYVSKGALKCTPKCSLENGFASKNPSPTWISFAIKYWKLLGAANPSRD